MLIRLGLVVLLGGLFVSPGRASVIEFRSGQWEFDKAVRYHWYDPHVIGPHDPTGHFGQAQAGPMAQIWRSDPNGWGQLPTFKTALPVYNWELLNGAKATDWGSSSLFAAPFYVPDTHITAATLLLEYTIDNYLGGKVGSETYQGIFINGQPLSGDTFTADPDANRFVMNKTLTRSDVGPLLWPNQINWLYINVSDKYPQAGVLFGARITTLSNPEPASLIAWSLLALFGGAFGYRRFARRR